jgi:phosphopantetheine adenylyltransferase
MSQFLQRQNRERRQNRQIRQIQRKRQIGETINTENIELLIVNNE